MMTDVNLLANTYFYVYTCTFVEATDVNPLSVRNGQTHKHAHVDMRTCTQTHAHANTRLGALEVDQTQQRRMVYCCKARQGKDKPCIHTKTSTEQECHTDQDKTIHTKTKPYTPRQAQSTTDSFCRFAINYKGLFYGKDQPFMHAKTSRKQKCHTHVTKTKPCRGDKYKAGMAYTHGQTHIRQDKPVFVLMYMLSSRRLDV